MFYTKSDNSGHNYVLRWMIDGKIRYVSTDDWIPGRPSTKTPYFSKVTRDG